MESNLDEYRKLVLWYNKQTRNVQGESQDEMYEAWIDAGKPKDIILQHAKK